MRLRLLVLALATAVLAAPAAAQAAPTVGISDNRWQMLADPLFTALGVKQVRIVVSYDAIAAGRAGDDEIAAKVDPYIKLAAALGIDPMIAFEHSRGDAANECKKKNSKKVCALPSDAAYQAAVTEFLVQYPTVKTITAWNEGNHYTQPTSRNPKAAGRFANIVKNVCTALQRSCKIYALDVLDQADDPAAKRPKYKATVKWIKQARGAVKGSLSDCGIHNYSDVNRFRLTGTRALIKAMKCKRYSLTETGGLYDFGSFWSSKTNRKNGKCKSAAACQLKATKFLFKKTVKVSSKIKSVYIYNWFGGNEPRFDAGIVKGKPGGKTKKRPAYNEVSKRV